MLEEPHLEALSTQKIGDGSTIPFPPSSLPSPADLLATGGDGSQPTQDPRPTEGQCSLAPARQ